jgi:hypothetical protein
MLDMELKDSVFSLLGFGLALLQFFLAIFLFLLFRMGMFTHYILEVTFFLILQMQLKVFLVSQK